MLFTSLVGDYSRCVLRRFVTTASMSVLAGGATRRLEPGARHRRVVMHTDLFTSLCCGGGEVGGVHPTDGGTPQSPSLWLGGDTPKVGVHPLTKNNFV